MAFRYKDQAQLYIKKEKRSDQKSAAEKEKNKKKRISHYKKNTYLSREKMQNSINRQAPTMNSLVLKAPIHSTIYSQNKPFIIR